MASTAPPIGRTNEAETRSIGPKITAPKPRSGRSGERSPPR
jgi:hypothetical protein